MANRKCPVCGHIEGEFVYFCTECGARTEETNDSYVSSSVKTSPVIEKPKMETISAKKLNENNEFVGIDNSVQLQDQDLSNEVKQDVIVSQEPPQKKVSDQIYSQGKNENKLNKKTSELKVNPMVIGMGAIIIILVMVVIALATRGNKNTDQTSEESKSEISSVTQSEMSVIDDTPENQVAEEYETPEPQIEMPINEAYEETDEIEQEETVYEKVDSEFEIYSGVKENYADVLEPGYFEYYNSGIADFSFWYPTNLYCGINRISEEDEEWSEYGQIVEEVDFYGSEGSELTYKLIRRSDNLSLEDATNYIHDMESSYLFAAEDIVNGTTADHGKVIVTGWDSASRNYAVYDLYKIEGDYFMQMRVMFPNYTGELDKKQKAYVTECYYRLCGFSDSKAGTRSYQEFMENN